MLSDCDNHKLLHVEVLGRSQSGRYVYGRCRCGARRVLPLAAWEQEAVRRVQGYHVPQEPVLFGTQRLYGPELACCGQWWPVTGLPFRCPTCERVYLWPN